MSSRKNSSIRISFSFRLALIYTVVLCVSFAVLLSVTYQRVRHVAYSRDREVIQAQTREYKALFERGGVDAVSAYFMRQSREFSEQTFIRIIDHTGQVHFITLSHPLWGLLDQEPSWKNWITSETARWNELFREEASGSWVVGTTPLASGVYLQVGRSNMGSRQVLAHFRKISFFVMFPALVLSLLIGWLMTRGAIFPLRSLVETMRSIQTTGDLQQRVPARAHRGELGALTTMFNRMLDQNERLVQRSRDSLDHVAHDLRTPMTHLRNAAEQALLDPNPDPEILKGALADCVEESEQILKMLNLLMDLAEADGGSMSLKLEPLSLSDLVRDVMDLYALVAEEQGIVLENQVPSDLSIQADHLRIRQCVGNLVDNALKYSPKNTTITLSGTRVGGFVELSVRDQGVGISQEEVPLIWNRLYRGEQSRTTSGLGLGLSYVRAIISAHGGTVDVLSQRNEGTTFILRLPA